MSERWDTFDSSAEQVIRPPASGWSSAGGVPDVEPRSPHSSGHLQFATPRAELSVSEYLRITDLRQALLDLERRTAGRRPTRSERRLADRYRRLMGDHQGDQP